jgi:hypothetical protein
MKTLWKIKETKKAFFGKYIYKVSLELRGISQLKRSSLADIASIPKPMDSEFNIPYYKSKQEAYQNKAEILSIGSFLEIESGICDFKTRAEGSTFNIYTNDRDFVDRFLTAFGKHVFELYEPATKEAGEFLKKNMRKIICDELPNGLFRYKVHIGYKTIPEKSREGFLNWTKKYGEERIYMPRSTKNLLGSGGSGFCYGQYFYVSDEKMLNMTLMFFSDYVNKTENYILKSELV